MGRRLVVADIHGCATALRTVLEGAHYNPDCDRLFLLGDYVDRGPEIKQAVELAMALSNQGAVALLGNHDADALNYLDPSVYQTWTDPRNGGLGTLEAFGGSLPDHVINWLAERLLYYEEPDYILVHAGLKPGIELAEQDPFDLLWIRGEFHHGYRGKPVIFGHTPTRLLHGRPAPWYGTDKIGIDTGSCFREVYGGCLTLFDMDTHQYWTA